MFQKHVRALTRESSPIGGDIFQEARQPRDSVSLQMNGGRFFAPGA